MSARLRDDPWMQALALAAVLSGGVTALQAAHKGPPAAAFVSDAEKPPTWLAPRPGAKPFLLPPKPSGRWLVDAAGGRGADAAELKTVILSARDGDLIEIRPGRYKGGFSGLSSSLVVEGTTDRREDVVIEAPPGQEAATASQGRLALRHLTLKGSSGSVAKVSAGGTLELTDVELTGSAAAGIGVLVASGTLEASAVRFSSLLGGVQVEAGCRASVRSSDFSGVQTGFAARDGGSLTVTRTQLTGLKEGVRLVDKASAVLEQCVMSAGASAASVSGGSSLIVNGGAYEGVSTAFWVNSQSSARLEGVRVKGGEFAVLTGESAKLELIRSSIEAARVCGVTVGTACSLRASESRFEGGDQGLCLGDDSSAALERVSFSGQKLAGLGAKRTLAVSLKEVSAAKAEGSCLEFVGSRGVVIEEPGLTECERGLLLEGADAEVKRGTIANSALAFMLIGKSALRVSHTRLEGNRVGFGLVSRESSARLYGVSAEQNACLVSVKDGGSLVTELGEYRNNRAAVCGPNPKSLRLSGSLEDR